MDLKRRIGASEWPEEFWMVRRRRTTGTTLIEILVVIVIFLIGILAIVQIFPGGFRILGLTRNQAMAVQLSRTEIERLKGRPDQLPDQILPVSRIYTASDVTLIADPNRSPGDLGPYGASMNLTGDLFDASGTTNLGYWRYLSGANVFTRVIGEGRVIPAPRLISAPSVNPAIYGGLMALQFSPIVYNSQYDAEFPVYGNDMSAVDGAPDASRARSYQFFVENVDTNSATLYVPSSTVRPIKYRLAMIAYVSNGSGTQQRDVVDAIVTVPADPTGAYASFPLSSFAGLQAGETFVGAEFESIRLARLFTRLQLLDTFDNDPYEFKLLNTDMGILLFNPVGYNYMVPTRGGKRVPLTARVNYDVYDWGVIREQFRIPGTDPSQLKLAINNLKNKGRETADGTPYAGLPFKVETSNGLQNIDVALMDEETGGFYLYDETSPVDPTRSSYSCDHSIGLVRFQDYDPSAPGLQLRLVLPQSTTPITVEASGRSIRVFYRANNEWSVQMLKAASQYYQSGAAGGIGTFFLTGVNSGPTATRIYFPWVDLGRKVNVGELYYIDGSGTRVGPVDFSSVIQDKPLDSVGKPYIDVKDLDPNAQGLDFSNGYAVRWVKGASIGVRVLWNPGTFKLDNDFASNFNRFRTFQEGWRHNTTETFLQRGDNQ